MAREFAGESRGGMRQWRMCGAAHSEGRASARRSRGASARPSDNGTELVTTFRSAEDGTFRLSLPPGRYRIDEDPRSPARGFMKSVVVDVRKGHFTKVYLFYDIGMR
jgi:hypothetical protein